MPILVAAAITKFSGQITTNTHFQNVGLIIQLKEPIK